MPRKMEEPTVKELGKGNAISKVCAVLSALTAQSPLRLNEISEATGLNCVTALRILEELTEAGFIVRGGNPPRYDFGPEVVAIRCRVAVVQYPRCRAPQPAAAGRPERGYRATRCELVQSRSWLTVSWATIRSGPLPDIGSRRPLGIGGGSMALLAWLPRPNAMPCWTSPAAGLLLYPRIDRAILQDHIAQAQARDYVAMFDIVVEKMRIGLPLRDAQEGRGCDQHHGSSPSGSPNAKRHWSRCWSCESRAIARQLGR
jgi:DNA-binding IclR family transcriptional regulator